MGDLRQRWSLLLTTIPPAPVPAQLCVQATMMSALCLGGTERHRKVSWEPCYLMSSVCE